MKMEGMERQVGPLTVELHYDETGSGDPREWDNLGTMVTAHRHYALGDVRLRGDEHDRYGSIRNYLIAEHDALADTILPLYLFDHSGLSISTSDTTFQAFDSAGWDWGLLGFIFATPERCAEIGHDPDDAEQLRRFLVSEVEEYDSYLRGEVYGYVVRDAAGEVTDSCWGFLGEIDYPLAEGEAFARASLAFQRWETARTAQLEGVGL